MMCVVMLSKHRRKGYLPHARQQKLVKYSTIYICTLYLKPDYSMIVETF